MELKDHQESLLRILFRETEPDLASELQSSAMDSIFDQHCRAVRGKVEEVFGVFQKTVGEVDFEKILLEFYAQYRPLSADLSEVPQEFFAFFTRHNLALDIPVLLALAKLELRREQARLAPHSNPLSLELLIQKLASPEIATFSLQAHVQINTFEHPVFTIWQWAQVCSESATSDECARLPIQEYAESTLSFRKNSVVQTRRISRVEANLLREFRAGRTLAQIESSLGRVIPSFIESLLSDELLRVDE